MSKLLAAIWLILTLDCEQSARLSSEAFDRRLTLSERIACWIHRRICKRSRILDLEMRLLQQALHSHLQATAPTEFRLSGAARDRIRQRLNSQ